MSLPGRNELCGCGSGKKFKKCCLASTAPTSNDLAYRRFHDARNDLVLKLFKYAAKVYGPQAVHIAWDDFHYGEQNEGFHPESPRIQTFVPWFLYHWVPSLEYLEDIERANDPLFLAPAESFLLEHPGNKLSTFERAHISSCLKTPFSFHEVIHASPEVGLSLRDIFTGVETFVNEKRASGGARVGDILFAKVVFGPEFNTLEGSADIMIPPIHKAPILKLRSFMQKEFKSINADVLFECEIELFELFADLRESLINPVPPILTNTDGDLFVPHKLIFEIESTEKNIYSSQFFSIRTRTRKFFRGCHPEFRG